MALSLRLCQARAMSRAGKAFPLARWYVISLRPLDRHAAVRRAAAKFGARTFALSTLRLEALPAGAALRQALACPRIVATSPAAVRFAHAQKPLRPRQDQHWFALGAGTAAALRRLGIGNVHHPMRGNDSESVLDLEGLAQVAGEPVGLVTAPGGRGLLASQLRARGAQLQVAEVYRRVPLAMAAARLRELLALPTSTAVLVSSGEALAALWQALDVVGQLALSARPAIASSERLAAHMRALGFTTVLVARDTQPASMLATLVDHVGDSGFR